MKKFILSISVLFFLSACNSGGGGSSAPAKPLNEQFSDADSATDFTKVTAAENYTLVKADLSYDEQKEMYSIGCKTPGAPSFDDTRIDPKLLVGHTFVVKEVRSALLETDSSQVTERTIAELNGDLIKTNYNFIEGSFSGPFTSIDQIFVSKPHMVMTATYPKDGRGEFSYVPNYTQAARDYVALNSPTSYVNCDVSFNFTGNPKVDKVMYFFGGRQVTAFIERKSYAGDVTCTRSNGSSNSTTFNLGKGHRDQVTISTNETVFQTTVWCGGDPIYRAEKIVLDSGKIVSSEVTKTISAPLR